MITPTFVAFIALTALFGPSQAQHDTAYAGLALRDNPEGVVVQWVGPGPFDGDGMRSASLWRGDCVVSINERKVAATEFKTLIESLAPGDELRVEYLRRADADAHIGDAVPSCDPNGERRSVAVKLAARADWTGTLGRPVRDDVVLGEAAEGGFEREFLARATEAGIRDTPDGVDALSKYLRDVQDSNLDANSSPWVVRALRRPLSLDAIDAELTGSVREFVGAAQSAAPAAKLVRFVLDGRTNAPASFDVAQRRREVAADIDAWERIALEVVRGHRDDVSIAPKLAKDGLAMLRASPQVASRGLALELSRLESVDEIEHELATHAAGVPDELRERVQAAVGGEVSAAFLVGDDLCVVGGEGDNEYAMDLVARVYDRGGQDRYVWRGRNASREQFVFDLEGDDEYESSADFAGPGVGVFGLSLIDDRGGDDAYRTTSLFSQACGLFGVGLVLDRGGSDYYESSSEHCGFAQGVGYFGAGLLVDLAGDDEYSAQKLSQGVGGPRGFGAIIDVAGDDEYNANGPTFPSVYGTPDAFVGMSQGMGYGLRRDAAGGVGALFDLGGNDRYDVGEFGQGCGYFFGLGLLHDASGNDDYVGQRYAQGTGAHQAAGMLVDERGNDSYLCKQVAFQGGAWDQTVAWLLDREGDDTYRGFGLGQGAAAQQAIGVLVDLGGKDRYDSPQAQGECGGNEYHFDADKVFSFSVQLDRGGAEDSYSTGRANDAVTTTGARNEATPAASTLYGICIDD